MDFYVLTLFPDMVRDGLNHSILKRAQEQALLRIQCTDIRDYTRNKHRRTDDYPYGGGAGMVMTPEPVYLAYQQVACQAPCGTRVLYLTPQGKPFSQALAEDYAREKALILLCGHYEGVDERVLEEIVTDEVSLGDFVLTGGEIAAMAIIDAVARLLPGVLGREASFQDESFSQGLLEYPQYTRPPEFLGKPVPEVLLSGHHKRIAEWRSAQALERTRAKRPDLLE